MRTAARAVVPQGVRRWLSAKGAPAVWPPVGFVRFGSLRRLRPISRTYGFDRGLPIDRYYIEDFLGRHAGSPGYSEGDIRGRVLEVGDRGYTDRFGRHGPGSDGVTQADVLHADRSNPVATIVGDLVSGSNIPADTFDCIICTQVLPVIYDVPAVIATLHRALKPGGVALVTAPGITASCLPDRDAWGDYWRFTSRSMRHLFESVFPPEGVRVEAYGNVLAAISFLHGLAVADLKRGELEARDPDYELVICVRAEKSA